MIDAECVACNLCVNVCPVENCITMERMEAGTVDPRTGQTVTEEYGNWTTHPNNPGAVAAESAGRVSACWAAAVPYCYQT